MTLGCNSRAFLLSISTASQSPLCFWHSALFMNNTGQSGHSKMASVYRCNHTAAINVHLHESR